MPTAPATDIEELRKRAVRLAVLVGADDGSRPTLEDEDPRFQVLTIRQGSGADQVDSARLRYDLSRNPRYSSPPKHLQDIGAPVKYHRQIEIRQLDEDEQPNILLAWGWIAQVQQAIDTDGESLLIDVRIDGHAFGTPLNSCPYFDPTADLEDPENPQPKRLELHTPWVFQPEIDGKIENNMSTKEDEDAEPDDDGDENADPPRTGTLPRYFVHPESMRTAHSRTLQNQSREGWTLARAVHRLCWSCNPLEQFIVNPAWLDLDVVLSDGDDDVKNIRIPYGRYLPDCLDALLSPLGYSWRLRNELQEPEDSEEDEPPLERVTTIDVYRRGRGDPVEITMQRVGESLDLRKTTVDRFRAGVNLVELANRIRVRGNFPRIEGTFRLYAAWPAADDNLDPATLEPGAEDYVYKPDVFRKFVLNEAGDYVDDRTYPEGAPRIDFGDTNLADVLSDVAEEGWFQRRRRRLHPCLAQTEAEDGTRESKRYVVEFWDRDADEAEDPDELLDPGWTPVRTPYSVLEKECGIHFHKVPGDLYELHQEIVAPVHFAIVAVTDGPAGACSVRVTGDILAKIATGKKLRIRGSTGNDGLYTVRAGSTSGGGETTVNVEESIPDSTADGRLDLNSAAIPGLFLRVTACVDADIQIEAIHAADDSPQGETIELSLDLRDKFHFRRVSDASRFVGDQADEVDDQERLDDYAERVAEIENAANVTCELSLPGVDHHELQIGQLVEKLSGREIDLRGNADDAPEPRRLQIVAIERIFEGGQRTELTLAATKVSYPNLEYRHGAA